MHRYRPTGTEEGAPIRESSHPSIGVSMGTQATAPHATAVHEKYNEILHAGVMVTSGRGSRRPDILSISFMKKYIQYAKTRIRPTMSQEAADRAKEIYVGLRNDTMEGNQRRTSPLTVRTFETLIRLATAHAKSRLSSRVEEQDVQAAESILRFALFKEVVEDESRKKRRKKIHSHFASSSEENLSDSNDAGDEGDKTFSGTALYLDQARLSSGTAVHSRSRTGERVRRIDENTMMVGSPGPRESLDHVDGVIPREGRHGGTNYSLQLPQIGQSFQAGSSQDDSELAVGATTLTLSAEHITQERLSQFRACLGQLLHTALFEDDSADVHSVVQEVNRKLDSNGGVAFSKEEAVMALRKMDEANQIMLVLPCSF